MLLLFLSLYLQINTVRDQLMAWVVIDHLGSR